MATKDISVRRSASAQGYYNNKWPSYDDAEPPHTGGYAKSVSFGVVPRSNRHYTSFDLYGTGSAQDSQSASNVWDRVVTRAVEAIPRTESPSGWVNSQGQPKPECREPAHGYTPGLLELVEFFRTYEPPPTNLMSISDDASMHDDRARWSRLKHIGSMVRRSKSISHSADRPLQLPDSAVSGRTSAGHRHIAISIPQDAWPYGTQPRSQYPVYHANDMVEHRRPYRTGMPDHVRFTNRQGGITVLPQVYEQYALPSPVTSFPGFSRRKLPPIPGPPPTTALPPVGQRARTPNKSKSSDSITYAAETTGSTSVQEANRTMRRAQSTTSSSRRASAYGSHPPVAMASMHRAAFSRPSARPSIDNIISPPTDSGRSIRATSKSRPVSTSSVRDEEHVLGACASVALDGPISKQDLEAEKSASGSKTRKDAATSTDDLLLLQTAETRSGVSPARSEASRDRRDRVRSLKQRDMETLRGKKGVDHRGSVESLASSTKERPQTSRSYVPMNSFTPIMVVADLQPSEDRASKVWSERKRKDLEITAPSTGYVTKVEREQTVNSPSDEGASPGLKKGKSMSIPQLRRAARARASLVSSIAPESANPTPPHSPPSATQTVHVTQDRTALSRRREWKAAKTPKTPAVAEAMDAVKAKMREIMVSSEQIEQMEEGQMVQDQEFLRLYDAYREHRLQDMEKRMKRLERNGDVWRRALVPVLQNLNRSSALGERRYKSHTRHRESLHGPLPTGQTQIRGRARHRQSIGHCSTSTPSTANNDDLHLSVDLNIPGNSPTESETSGTSEGLDNKFQSIANGARERLARRGLQSPV